MPSKEKGRQMWKFMGFMPKYPCKEIIVKNGLIMGSKIGNMLSKILRATMKLLETYWIEQGVLHDGTRFYFEETLEKMTHVIFNITRYNVGNLVLIKGDDMWRYQFIACIKRLDMESESCINSWVITTCLFT
jgi:hypothetical protein